MVTLHTAVEHNINLLSQVEGSIDASLAHAAPATASAAAVDYWEECCSVHCQLQVAQVAHCTAQVLLQTVHMSRCLHS
jgi:hypothetical protein